MTWEPEKALPQSLIEEFENESLALVSNTCYGVTSHTLVSEDKNCDAAAPSAKRIKMADLSDM